MSERDGVGYVPFLPFGLICLNYRLPKTQAPTLVTVGDHLRARRKVLGLTQAEAANRIGVVRDAVAKWESGLRKLDRRNMPSVIRFLGYDPQPPATTFGELIGRTRRTLGLNQTGIAKALGVPTQSLRMWERGCYMPKEERRRLLEARIVALMAAHADLKS